MTDKTTKNKLVFAGFCGLCILARMKKMLHTLRVADVRQETPDCVSVALQIPAYLEPVFEYKAGQYITLETKIEGEAVRRSYSLCSSPFAVAPAPSYPSRKERQLEKDVV